MSGLQADMVIIDDPDQVLCAQCGIRPAVCLGLYEGEHRDTSGRFAKADEAGSCDPKLEQCSDSVDQPACGECCGHGNEDGHCHPIGQSRR